MCMPVSVDGQQRRSTSLPIILYRVSSASCLHHISGTPNEGKCGILRTSSASCLRHNSWYSQGGQVWHGPFKTCTVQHLRCLALSFQISMCSRHALNSSHQIVPDESERMSAQSELLFGLVHAYRHGLLKGRGSDLVRKGSGHPTESCH